MRRIIKKNQGIIWLMTALIFAVLLFPGSAVAMKLYDGSDTKITLGLKFAYAVARRMSDQDPKLWEDGQGNTDDSNVNFEKGDLVNNKFTFIVDFDIKYKNNYGLFARGKALYDTVYLSNNSNDSPDSNAALIEGEIKKKNQWPEAVEDSHGKYAELLDLFAYASFRLLDTPMDFRVGKQVISWGESFFIANISGAQAPLDAAARLQAGPEVKELYLPTEAAYLQVGLTEDLGLNMYYQWKWRKGRVAEGGTFFSEGDMVDEVKLPFLYESAPGVYGVGARREKDDPAKDDGQFGVALNYLLPWGGGTEIGIYYINYHDKTPNVEYDMSNLAAVKYHLSYTEDIMMKAVSFNTNIGAAYVGGDLSYREGMRFDNGAGLVEPGNLWQANLVSIYVFNPHVFSDGITVMPEIVAGKIVGNKALTTQPEGYGDFAYTYIVRLMFDWFQVAPQVDTQMNLIYNDTPVGWVLPVGAREGYALASIGYTVIYDNRLKVSLGFDDRRYHNPQADRDVLVFAASYDF